MFQAYRTNISEEIFAKQLSITDINQLIEMDSMGQLSKLVIDEQCWLDTKLLCHLIVSQDSTIIFHLISHMHCPNHPLCHAVTDCSIKLIDLMTNKKTFYWQQLTCKAAVKTSIILHSTRKHFAIDALIVTHTPLYEKNYRSTAMGAQSLTEHSHVAVWMTPERKMQWQTSTSPFCSFPAF